MTRKKPTPASSKANEAPFLPKAFHMNDLIFVDEDRKRSSFNEKSLESLPKWLDAMKTAMIQDADIVRRGMLEMEARNKCRVAVIMNAAEELSAEIKLLELGGLFRILSAKAADTTEFYKQMIGTIDGELATEHMNYMFIQDRERAKAILEAGMLAPGARIEPANAMEAIDKGVLRMVMSLEE